MNNDIPEFGSRIDGIHYTLRPGAYALISNDEHHLAIVRTPAGLYLPGGGIEKDESPEQALIRETMEECGMMVRIGRALGMADQLIALPEPEVYICKRGIYFMADIVGISADSVCEPDHELVWMTATDAATQLRHEAQRWMVGCAFRLQS